MSRRIPAALLLALGCLLGTASVQGAVDETGAVSFRLQGRELVTASRPYVEYYLPRTAEGIKAVSPGAPAYAFEARTKTQTAEYPWGKIAVQYTPGPNRLDLEVTVENRGPDPIFHLSVNLLEVRFPTLPAGEEWQQAHVAASGIDSLPSVLADFGSATLLLAGIPSPEDYSVGFFKLGGQPAGSFGINLSTLEQRTADTYHQELSIAAGQKKTYLLTLRSGPAGATRKELAADLYPRFAKLHPSALKWADRRPIGAILLSSSAAQHRSAMNPRAWLNDPKLNARDPKAFRKRLLGWAQESVRVLKGVGAQGMIFWDPEGEELPHPTTFIGDPRLVPKFAPELDAVADELFGAFRTAGLRTGVCIRPSRIRIKVEKGDPVPVFHDHMGFDPVTEMSAKIDNAQKRWGCTLFYVDTNVTWAFSATENNLKDVVSWPMRAEQFRRLAALHPDVLLIPEFQYLGYASHTAAYRELSAGATGTPDAVRLTYPNAFSVIKVEDEKLFEANRPALLESIRRGDLLLFPGWYNPPVNAKVRALYAAARKAR